MLLDRLVERPGDLSFWKTKLKDEKSYVIWILPKKKLYSFCDFEYSFSSSIFLQFGYWLYNGRQLTK